MTDEQQDAARELRRVREKVRREALITGGPALELPPPAPARRPESIAKPEPPKPQPSPTAPDAGPVNEAWRAEPAVPGGLRGALFRMLDRILKPRFEAQQTFNAQQVQLDNELLRHLQERFAITHRHYDGVLGVYGRHLGEIDERHMILQEELVVHVEDIIRRIDLVLARAEQGQLSLEHDLRDLRRRLQRLEETLTGSRTR